MKTIDLEKMSSLSGGRFMGIGEKCTGCIMGWKHCRKQLYIFWIPVNDSWTSYDGAC